MASALYLLLFSISFLPSAVFSNDGSDNVIIGTGKKFYDLEDLLRPMRNLQIIIRPDEQTGLPPEFQALLAQAVKISLNYLNVHLVPVQLVSSTIPTTSYHSRYVENQVSWVVFLPAYPRDQVMLVAEILGKCCYWKGVILKPAILHHLIHAVILDNAGYFVRWNMFVAREFTPFYLVVFYFPFLRASSLDHVWAFDVWFDETNKRVIDVPQYFSLAEKEGIHAAVKHVNSARKDFLGTRLIVAVMPYKAIYCPSRTVTTIIIIVKGIPHVPLNFSHTLFSYSHSTQRVVLWGV